MRIAAFVVSLLAASVPLAALAAEAPAPGGWIFSSTAGVNLSESAYSNNWAGGDKGQFAWVVNSNSRLERQFTTAFNLTNTLQLAYGQTSKQKSDPDAAARRVWDVPEKSTDLVLFETTARWSANGFVDPFLAGRLESQFEDRSHDAGVLHFTPVKLTETAGVARVLEKTDKIETITRVGFGFRQSIARTFASNDVVHFTTNDGGVEWLTTATRPLLAGRVAYKGRLVAFLPVFFSKSKALEDFDAEALAADGMHVAVGGYWRTPDINFQNTFTAQITKALSVDLFAQAVYDKFDSATNVDPAQSLPARAVAIEGGIRKAVQIKQTMSLGLSWKLK